MKKTHLFLIVLLTTITINAQSTTGLSEISKESLIANVRILTSPDFDGRLPGSEGYNKAAQFAAISFMSLD
jgi:hypothetical protein